MSDSGLRMRRRTRPTITGVELPRWVPALMAALLLLVVAAACLQSAQSGDLGVVRVLGALLILPLARLAGLWSPRIPAVVAGVGLAVAVAMLTGLDQSSAGWFVLVLFAGQAATTMPLPHGLVVYAAGLLAAGLGVQMTPDQGWVSWFIGISFGFWGGWAARWRIEGLEAERTTAITAERQRLAHDLHDAVAHTLAVTVLHLGGARLAVEHEPAEAAAAIAEAERLARESMAQLRSIVSVLAEDGDRGRQAPQPQAKDVPALLDQYRAAGLTLHAAVQGDLAAVTPTQGVALYRITQEALANAARHAPGQPVAVSLSVGADGGVRLEVSNPLNGHARGPVRTGIGVVSMVDRARAVGGSLDATPTAEAWTVRADLPGAPGS